MKRVANLGLLCLTAVLAIAVLATGPKSAVNASSLQSGRYSLDQDFKLTNFYDYFNFYDTEDPTHGFVRYVNESEAWAKGYIKTTEHRVFMSPDRFGRSPNGRESVRIESKKQWHTGLFVLVLEHMPGGQCGSWPAFWLCGENWPHRGEIDIIEGVNTDSENQMTLHTAQNCTMDRSASPWRHMTGQSTGDNCDVWETGNSGCGVKSNTPMGYGMGFNSGGGGAYVTEWTKEGIKVWYFNALKMPTDLLSEHPNPSDWTQTPDAVFPFGSHCASDHFGHQRIIFDITFCGDWAGNVFQQSGCPGSCKDFVANSPQSFIETYWSILALRVYKQE